MTHNQNTITCHYQQLQPYERGLIMARHHNQANMIGALAGLLNR
ncbi:hypothetical protein [Lactiplantibacillus plantarum]|nr:hypothetical protein [Lactiplantibacillus plantarum]